MTPLPSHEAFEAMLRPRRPTQDGFFDTYAPWTVISFYAKWCAPCKRLDKKSIVDAYPEIQWYSCDIDENPTTLPYCSLRTIPSFALLKDGIFVETKSIISSPEDVIDWLDEKVHLSPPKTKRSLGQDNIDRSHADISALPPRPLPPSALPPSALPPSELPPKTN
jgi:thiol-disulfide isomerase/thioredoxin